MTLTEEQQKLLASKAEEYVLKLTAISSDEDIVDAVNSLYAFNKLEKPKIFIGRSPQEIIHMNYFFEQGHTTLEEIENLLKKPLPENIEHGEYLSKMNVFFWTSNWAVIFDIGKNHLNIPLDSVKYETFMKVSNHVASVLAYKGVCFVSRKPVNVSYTVTKNTNKYADIDKKYNAPIYALHKEGDAAVKYADGFKQYALNGISVPEWLAVTPAGLLKPEQYKDIKSDANDIKAEFIRKIGVDRMVEYGRIIDVYSNHKNAYNYEWYANSEYKVVDMHKLFPHKYKYLPYLYMKNQTTGVYHLECVYDPRLGNGQPRTIIEALTVRNSGINPEDIDYMFIK